MKKLGLFFVLCHLLFFYNSHIRAQHDTYADKFQLHNLVEGKDYATDKIIVKLKPGCESFFLQKNNALYQKFGSAIGSVEKMFPSHKPPAKSTNAWGQPMVDISLIHTVYVSSEISIEEYINSLHGLECFAYAEPYFYHQLLYYPDDPFINQQYYLSLIKAYEAWAITKGDTNIVIGIVDTGTDLAHADLYGNIKFNYNDPINGYDTDNDGFVDNFQGWDFGENDNYPQYNANPHGVHVSGIASATTDNGAGVAGVGFKSKFLPVKVTNENGVITHGYQGIVYAADQGCRVINCSWGGPTGVGQFGQDIINYATYNQNALVVAAAGNSNSEHLFYPASYDNVLSVAATDANDNKWSGSTYNYRVDISAPGHQIFSTWVNGAYTSSSGTSMAAPIVAGGAALLAAHFPNYLPMQLAAQLKATADNIDTITANMPYTQKLGKGRLNLYRALTETHHPYVRKASLNYSDEQLGAFAPGDTVFLSANFVNYLAEVHNLNCTLRALSPYITLIDSVINFPHTINTLDTVNNVASPFSFLISTDIPVSQNVDFELLFDAGSYSDNQFFAVTFNKDYLTLDTNRVKTTLTSKSRIGYNNMERTQGEGFIYNNMGESLLRIGGLIMGVTSTQIVDNIYGSNAGSYNDDFFAISPVKQKPSAYADFFAQSVFNDSLAGNKRIYVRVINNYYAWNNPDDDNYFITEYNIINESGSELTGFYAGLFMDWSIQDNRLHRADYDVGHRMGYAYSTMAENYTATKMLTPGSTQFYAFDNITGVKFNDGFTGNNKYYALRFSRLQAGANHNDNYIATLISSGPHTFAHGDTLTIAMAVIAGNHLNAITESAIAAQLRYDNAGHFIDNINPMNIENLLVYPNPAHNNINISFQNNRAEDIKFSILNSIGQKVYEKVIFCKTGVQNIEIPVKNLSGGLYILKVEGEHFTVNKKISIL